MEKYSIMVCVSLNVLYGNISCMESFAATMGPDPGAGIIAAHLRHCRPSRPNQPLIFGGMADHLHYNAISPWL